MKKSAIQIIILAAALLIVCIVCRLAMNNTYMAEIHIPMNRGVTGGDEISVSTDRPGIVEYGAPSMKNGRMRVPIRPGMAGETFMDIRDTNGDELALLHFHVDRFGTVYDKATGGFTGDSIVLATFTVFCLAVSAIMFSAYHRAKGPAFYRYGTIYAAGFSLFALLTGLLMLMVTVRHISKPFDYSMLTAYDAITSASWRFMMVTAPLLLAFAAAMAVSNIELLRHERFRPQNVLGIGVGILLVAGEALAFYLYSRDFAGPEWEGRVRNTLQNVYATGYAYFECMLIGAIVCGLKAAQYVPEVAADYILILGCRFRRDGTLTPLLKGRTDRAIEYWKEQKAQTGREAVLMPCGGQGLDEPMSEAEAMRRYLVEQGLPADRIVLEDRSGNTFQNMVNAKRIIEKDHPDARVVYATTNYHVFRSGVWASLAGLPAEGMGSRTKWWYWPNAFMRECAGLFLNRIWQELALLLIMIAFFGALSMVLG